MRHLNKILVFLLIGSLSCSENDETIVEEALLPSNSKNKIMPLGASRVEGERPEYESYRYELWKLLIDNTIAFDYIGTRKDEASYPDYNDFSFDNDHEGRGGWTSGQIRSEIDSWLGQAGVPDIVLLSSPGGNDALEGLSYDATVVNINGIIDIIQSANPNVTILIEQMAPARSDQMTGELTTFLNRLTQDVVSIAAEKSTGTSKVLVVDMATGFNDSLLADDVHYNEAGAQFIAERYFEVLNGFLE